MKISLLFTFLLVFNLAYAQKSTQERESALLQLASETKLENENRQKRVEKYARENGREIWETKNGVTTMMYDIQPNGTPSYITTFNEGAAVTTGAAYLANQDAFGVALTGKDVKVGVWDGGKVRSTHVEFGGGVKPSDAAPTLNFHATHVTGTIKASGVNARAKGMAPDVELSSYDWNDDDNEMISNTTGDETSILLSNHSYGLISGWNPNNGTWVGDPNISNDEDWKFGFYTSAAQSLDAITRNAPYYTIIWAAGNDRGDSGDGSHPSDGPYDIIGPRGNAKNIITVGAVNKIRAGYEKAEDVVMSGFSSWGPTDDGRIKPDLVGAGVSVLSTFETGDDSYGSLNGTSMASPNVTGTLALLQELNKKVNNEYLKSSTLKGLAIHTANEAGTADGPDYSFGWGLMNGEGAGNMILQENGINKIIDVVNLANNETYELDINAIAGKEVKVTICWTDLPGTPPEISLDPKDLMLVNDLDLRVSKDGEIHFPYILDPIFPNRAAETGDNFRDNVEMVKFAPEESGKHIVSVSHKGEIVEGVQEFSIIVSYESSESNTFYRVGSGNSWNSSENWASTSGGEAGTTVPGANDIVVFDNNTFTQMGSSSATSESISYSLDTDIEISKLIVSSGSEIEFLMNGNDVTVNNGLSVISDNVKFKGEGNIILKDPKQGQYPLGGFGESFSEANIIVDFTNGSKAIVANNAVMNNITVNSGELIIRNTNVSINSLILNGESSLSVENSMLTITKEMNVNENISFNNSELLFSSETNTQLNSGDLDSDLKVSVLQGTLAATSNLSISELNMSAGTGLSLADGKTLTIKNIFNTSGEEGSLVSLSSSGVASLQKLNNELICLDFLNISGVNVTGEAAFNAGTNSTIDNASGWQSVACEDVIFANFENNTVCEGSVETIIDISNGDIKSWKWFVDGVLASEDASPILQFPELQTYEIKLEVTGSNEIVDSYTKMIVAVGNTIPENEVLLSNNQLVSKTPADSYQWFKDDVLLEGETNRTITLGGDAGNYFVVTANETCSRKSPEFIFRVTSTEDDLFETEYSLYPNPANDQLNISVQSGYAGTVTIQITELSGKNVYSNNISKNAFLMEEKVNTSNLSDGLYVVVISQGDSVETRLVAIEK